MRRSWGTVLLVVAAVAGVTEAQPALFDSILAGRTCLRRGDRGEAVRAVQRRLNLTGANPRLSEDGIYGPNTEVAVRVLQRREGLVDDGIVGKNTLKRLLGVVDPWEEASPHPGMRPSDPSRYDDLIRVAAARHGNFDPTLLKALIYQESRFDAGATSDTGAAGLAQFTYSGRAEVRRLAALRTYRSRYRDEAGLLQRLQGLNRSMTYNPKTAIESAALLLTQLIAHYEGDEWAALTHYNAGGRAGSAVDRYGFDEAKRRGLLRESQASTYAPDVMRLKSRFDAGWDPIASAEEEEGEERRITTAGLDGRLRSG